MLFSPPWIARVLGPCLQLERLPILQDFLASFRQWEAGMRALTQARGAHLGWWGMGTCQPLHLHALRTDTPRYAAVMCQGPHS